MNLQTEPPIKKIKKLTDQAVLLFSGSVPDGEDVATRAIAAIGAMPQPAQTAVMAEAARQAYEDAKRKRIESILKPFLGVNFTQYQQLVAQSAASQLLVRSASPAPPRSRRRHVSKCMRRPVKQFELSGQHRDTQIRLGAREVGLKCV
jgi:hypothetical protein